MIDFYFTQQKVSKARKSCITPEQKSVFKNYQALYRARLRDANKHGQRQLVRDLLILLTIGFVSAFGILLTLALTARGIID